MSKNIEIYRKDKLIKELFDFKIVLILLLSIPALFSAGFDHNVTYWLLIITIPVLIFIIIKNHLDIYYTSRDVVLFLFLLWSGMSIVWSANYVRSIIEFLQLFSCVLVFVLIKNISESNLKTVIKITYITGTGVAVFGILEYLLIKGGRITSTFGNPNPLGIYIAILFLFLLGYILHSKYFDNKKYFSVLILLLTGLTLTSSRGSILALIFSIPLVFLRIKKQNLKISILYSSAILVGAVLLSYIIVYTAPFIQEGLGDKNLIESVVRVESGVPNSVTGRLEFWKVALQLVKYHPIQGFGLGTFFSAYYLEYNINEWYSRFAHNHYLQVIVEQGIVGFLLFISFIILSIKKIVRNVIKNNYNKYTLGALSGSLAFLMHIFIDFSWNFPAVSILFFALLGIGLRNDDTAEKVDFEVEKIKNNIIPNKVVLFVLVFIFLLNFWQFSSNKIFEKGVGLIEKSPDDALEIIELGNSYYPLNSRGFYYESKICFDRYMETKNKELLDKAIGLAEKSISLSKYDGFLNNYLGNIYLEIEEYETAGVYLQKGVQYGAYNLRYYIDLSTAYINLGKMNEEEQLLLKAVELIEPAVKKAPKSDKPVKLIEAAVIHHRLANIYESKDNTSLKNYHSKKEQEYLKEAFNNNN